MDYEQKYKEALGWMRGMYDGFHGKTKEEQATKSVNASILLIITVFNKYFSASSFVLP